MRVTCTLLYACLVSWQNHLVSTLSVTPPGDKKLNTCRRSLLLVPISSLLPFLSSSPAGAFDNAIPEFKKYSDRPKRRGTPPRDLAVLPRTTEGELDRVIQPGLRTCDGNPNCFSTTGDFRLEDRQQFGVDFFLSPWIPPPTDNSMQSLKTISNVVRSYEPGQGGIDGGGFSIIKEESAYLYYQFESLKKGYIDDLEFAVSFKNSDSGILVRSASRVGITDFGVNAIRLNYIASQLRSKGWTIDEITEKSHRDYWTAANEARDATFDADRRSMDN